MNTVQAQKDVRAAAKWAKSLVKAADALDELGNIEQLTRNARDELNTTLEETEKAKVNIAITNKQLKTIRSEHCKLDTTVENQLAIANKDAEVIHNSAKVEASNMIKEAVTKVSGLEKKAKAVWMAHSKNVESYEKEIDGLETKVTTLTEKLDGILSRFSR